MRAEPGGRRTGHRPRDRATALPGVVGVAERLPGAYNCDMSKRPPQLTVTQAAAQLGLHRNRILQLIAAGRLPAVQVGRWWILREADVEAFARLDRPAGNPNFQKKVKGR